MRNEVDEKERKVVTTIIWRINDRMKIVSDKEEEREEKERMDENSHLPLSLLLFRSPSLSSPSADLVLQRILIP